MSRESYLGKAQEEIEARTIAFEDEMLKLLYKQLEHLDIELEIRTKLSFERVNPEFAYENDPVYMDHLKKGLAINIAEAKLGYQQRIDSVLNNRSERAEIKRMKEEQ